MGKQLEFVSQNVAQTHYLGQKLGQLLQKGHLLCLDGAMGAGKTTLVSGIGQGWQSEDRVTSPTFTVVNIYQRAKDRQTLSHLDAYRLESASAVFSIGLDDILENNGPVIIEWPERVLDALPAERLWVKIADDEALLEKRVFVLEASDTLHEALLEQLRLALETPLDESHI